MLNARQASEKLAKMSPEDRFAIIKKRVSQSTRDALDAKIHEVIAAYERKVDITLSANVCRDPDKDIRALLCALGYTDISVTSDFPGYCESYTGTTTIRFSIP